VGERGGSGRASAISLGGGCATSSPQATRGTCIGEDVLMAGDRTTLEYMRQVFILIVGVLGLVLTVLGLSIHDVSALFVGVVFVVAAVMGEGLSHFAVSRGRLIMKSRARPPARRRL